jgi:2-hydroxy-3-keto-5-methylthiopentenyl-1-phosphate phosphatase
MLDGEFVEWCKERDIPIEYILSKCSGMYIMKQIAKEAYEDGSAEANWICSGRP